MKRKKLRRAVERLIEAEAEVDEAAEEAETEADVPPTPRSDPRAPTGYKFKPRGLRRAAPSADAGGSKVARLVGPEGETVAEATEGAIAEERAEGIGVASEGEMMVPADVEVDADALAEMAGVVEAAMAVDRHLERVVPAAGAGGGRRGGPFPVLSREQEYEIGDIAAAAERELEIGRHRCVEAALNPDAQGVHGLMAQAARASRYGPPVSGKSRWLVSSALIRRRKALIQELQDCDKILRSLGHFVRPSVMGYMKYRKFLKPDVYVRVTALANDLLASGRFRY